MIMHSMHSLDLIPLRLHVVVIRGCTGSATTVPRGKYTGGR